MQSSYTSLLAITAQTAWDTWYTFSDRACNDTATGCRWYIATFFSDAASRRYQWIGEMIGCGLALAILYTQRWAEAEVQSCLATEAEIEAMPESITTPATVATEPEPTAIEDDLPSLPELLAEAKTATQPAAAIAEPAAVAVVKVEARPEAPADLAKLKTAELRRLCSEAGIRWRNALGQNRHLPKAEMIAALAS